MEFYFTADTHFGHANIIKYTSRPFKSLHHMDTELINRWNSMVKDDDTVFFLGDFCFKATIIRPDDYIKQLNGQIIFIKGNYDSNNGIHTPILDIRIRYGGKEILLVHNSRDAGVGYDLVFCGHIHNNWKFRTFKFSEFGSIDLVNVGVDVWNYYPVKINEILKEYNKWKITGKKGG